MINTLDYPGRNWLMYADIHSGLHALSTSDATSLATTRRSSSAALTPATGPFSARTSSNATFKDSRSPAAAIVLRVDTLTLGQSSEQEDGTMPRSSSGSE